MAKSTTTPKNRGLLLKVLESQFRALVAAGCDDGVLKQYSTLLRFLRSTRGKVLEGSTPPREHRIRAHQESATLTEQRLREASLTDVEKLVNDDATTRKDLEFIAIQRFSVPRGSMRSFSNRKMLVDKLRALVRNERTHETIGAVARGEGKRDLGL